MNTIRFFLFSLIFTTKMAFAVDAVEFDSPQDLERYQQLTFELRCPKCQNQNLTDSNSQISVDLRDEVARLIREGKTNQEIKDQMVALHGDFILYNPPVQNNTIVLWVGPGVMLGIGLLIFGIIIFRRSHLPTEDDQLEQDVVKKESDAESNDSVKENENSAEPSASSH